VRFKDSAKDGVTDTKKRLDQYTSVVNGYYDGAVSTILDPFAILNS
jgi:hypothetical protein